MIFYITGGLMIGARLMVVVVYTGSERLLRKLDSDMPFIKSLEE